MTRTAYRLSRRYVRFLRAAKRQDPIRYRAEVRNVVRNAGARAYAWDPEIRRFNGYQPFGYDMPTSWGAFRDLTLARFA